ncbi:adenylate/guanylate cyclase domain-containing protein [Flexithrix dorotheae]|uniref:adenylate/guanylate cyclase domain-containing protein n=1 Tax=Flexithrix dorotheae TaxID=70993 RepID=UPI00036272DD|nr:adenylate/guanylate cyclase domain-containing protein [Flexithrix dorotheae]
MDKNFTILYVDDEQQNLISFKAAFRREFKILTAISGNEAMEILKENVVHLIITDQRMPEMTGVQFLEKVVPIYPDAIRMILTGFSDIEAIIDAINKGKVFRYISKPWDENELRMTIENAKTLYFLQKKNKQLVEELQHKVNEQERTLKLFMKFVPEQVVQKALNDTENSIFEGEVRNISVLFCDIRGFTSMSEEMQPKHVVSFLNSYYAMMTEVVKKHNGVVNQFVGDEIFAGFGAPVAYPNNEENAVFCALEMLEKLNEINEAHREYLKIPVSVGIGINSGEVVAGNLGSEDKIEYSVTGDTVNTGKRIEMLTKELPNSILMSESVFKKVGHLFETKAWEPVAVKGKKEKILVYEVLGKK